MFKETGMMVDQSSPCTLVAAEVKLVGSEFYKTVCSWLAEFTLGMPCVTLIQTDFLVTD